MILYQGSSFVEKLQIIISGEGKKSWESDTLKLEEGNQEENQTAFVHSIWPTGTSDTCMIGTIVGVAAEASACTACAAGTYNGSTGAYLLPCGPSRYR
jgi:hypothetical protein